MASPRPSTLGTLAAPLPDVGPYGIRFGNAITDQSERDRILASATDFVDRNERNSGNGANSYNPGFSREQAIQQAAYSDFPTHSAVAGPGSTSASSGGGGSVSGSSGSYTSGGARFPGSAPNPTPYGDFVAPTAASFEHSPDYQYLLDEQQKARQASAAARGTLLNTGTVKGLQRDAAGIAAGDFQNAYNRAQGTYTTNRATSAQNYGQSMDQFRGNLDAWNTGDSSALNWANFGLRKDAAARDAMPEAAGPSVTSYGPAAADNYAQYVASLRQAQQPQAPLLPLAELPGRLNRREYRGAGQ